jgi:hypothetical protein
MAWSSARSRSTGRSRTRSGSKSTNTCSVGEEEEESEEDKGKDGNKCKGEDIDKSSADAIKDIVTATSMTGVQQTLLPQIPWRHSSHMHTSWNPSRIKALNLDMPKPSLRDRPTCTREREVITYMQSNGIKGEDIKQLKKTKNTNRSSGIKTEKIKDVGMGSNGMDGDKVKDIGMGSAGKDGEKGEDSK